MDHPKDIGDRSTLAIMLVLRATGFPVFAPFGENTRADLIIESETKLYRVQCKTGRLRSGAVRFAMCSWYGHHPNPMSLARDYLDDVDYFAVYCPETSGVYLVPNGDLPLTRQAALRVEPPRNNQKAGIRFAGPYEIGRVRLESLATAELAGSAGAR